MDLNKLYILVFQVVWIADVTQVKTQEKQVGFPENGAILNSRLQGCYSNS